MPRAAPRAAADPARPGHTGPRDLGGPAANADAALWRMRVMGPWLAWRGRGRRRRPDESVVTAEADAGGCSYARRRRWSWLSPVTCSSSCSPPASPGLRISGRESGVPEGIDGARTGERRQAMGRVVAEQHAVRVGRSQVQPGARPPHACSCQPATHGPGAAASVERARRAGDRNGPAPTDSRRSVRGRRRTSRAGWPGPDIRCKHRVRVVALPPRRPGRPSVR